MRWRLPGHPVILLIAFLDATGVGIVVPVLPQLIADVSGRSLSGSSYVLGTLVALYSAVGFLVAPLLGRMADRFGRRPMLLLPLAVSCLDYLVAATTHSLPMLFVARAVAGACGASIVVANAYVADTTPADVRGQAFGLLGAVFGAGMILGPTLGGVLASNFGARAPFWAALVVAAGNLIAGALILRESLPPDQRRALRLRQTNPLTAFRSFSSLKLSTTIVLAIVFIHLASTMSQAVMVLFTQSRIGWTSSEVGIFLTVTGVLLIIMQGGVTGVAIARLGERHTVLLGFALSALGTCLYAFASVAWQIYLALAITSLGCISGPAIRSLISRPVPGNRRGELMGLLMSLGSLVTVVGSLLGTSLFGYFSGAAAPLRLPGAPFLLGALLLTGAFICVLRTPQSDTPPAQLRAPGRVMH
jgi:DHA1 family tetracycline resistance protein-like MFS transporter